MISSIKAYSKLKWTPEEQELLRNLKQEKSIDSWKTIAQEMNQIFLQKNRSGKQCRERYMNYVRFGNEAPKSTGWTQAEDQELFLKFMQYGAKWVQIGKQMPGRSQNCLKNRFYGAMRKIIRKINKAAKEKKLRQKKPIKADLLIRILQYQIIIKQPSQNNNSEACLFLEELKKEMIKIAVNSEQSSSPEQIQSLMGGIIKFCNLIKSPSIKKTASKPDFDDINEDIVESQECNLQNSFEKGSSQCELKQAGTLVENKSNQEGEGKPKIIKNFILVSSVDLSQKKTEDRMDQSNPDLGRSDEISWLRKFSLN